jgi:acyl carrier protein
VTATAMLGPETHWALDEHRIHGTAVLPGTGYLEMVRATFDRDGDGRPVVLRDVVFLAPLGVADGERKETRVVIEDGEDGAEFRVESRSGDRWLTHARGAVGWGDPGAAPVHDVEAIRARCPRRRDDAGVQASASGMLAFGPRWSSLKRATAGDGEELALLEASPDVAAELSRFGLHPALLDEATAFGEFDGAQGRYLPLGYGRLEVRAPLPPRLYSHLRHRDGGSGGVILCDIALLDESGAEVAEIRDFMLRQVDPRGLDASLAVEAPPAEAAMDDDDEVGIRPREGAEALLRVLGARPAPQVVVSALDMPTLIASVAKVNRDRLADELQGVAGGGVALEVLEGEYVEPTNDLERGLVVLWEEATGTRGIGIEHDFFEVGGNSLVAVQLMSRVRTTFGVKLPMRSLFESPTIAAMAAAIAAGAELAA